ncbi:MULTISPECIES: hypothetical protein [unclassified Microcoleus]
MSLYPRASSLNSATPTKSRLKIQIVAAQQLAAGEEVKGKRLLH